MKTVEGEHPELWNAYRLPGPGEGPGPIWAGSSSSQENALSLLPRQPDGTVVGRVRFGLDWDWVDV